MAPRSKRQKPNDEDDLELQQMEGSSAIEVVGRQLQNVGKAKDVLIKLLKKAEDCLGALRQDANGQAEAKSISQAMQQENILKHRDQDVRIRCAACFGQVLRIHAPDTPYSSDVLAEMFSWLLHALRGLENPSDPHFEACYSILDLASQTKCFLLLLDLNQELPEVSLVQDFFSAALDCINGESPERVKVLVVEILSTLVDESDDIPQDLLDLLLSGLVPPKNSDNPVLFEVTVDIIKRSENRLRPMLQKLLVKIIEGFSSRSSLKDGYHTLIYQIYRISPQIMLPVLPKLASELQLDQESKRLAALELLGRLLPLPGSDLDLAYPGLFEEFLKRACDQKAEVRQAFLRLSPEILRTCAASSRQQMVKEISDRLLDFEEKVRAAAVTSICSAATLCPHAIPQAALESAALRLRDKKVHVRHETAQQLMNLFRACCSDVAKGGELASSLPLVLWIPGRIALAVVRDPELSQHVLDQILKPGLIPMSIEAGEAAKIWGSLYMTCKPQERQALMRLIRMQATVRTHLRTFLDCRVRAGSIESEEAERKTTPPPQSKDAIQMKAALSGLIRTFHDQHKAQDLMDKLKVHKDNHVFRKMAELSEVVTSHEAMQKLVKEVVQRVGRGAVSDFARTLCHRLTCRILTTDCLEAILERLMSGGTDDDLGQALLELAADAAHSGPHLFARLSEQVGKLLDEDEADLSKLAAQILACAGAQMAKLDRESLEALLPKLEFMCHSGSPKAAKSALRAIANILPEESAKQRLSELCESLTDSLDEMDPSFLAKLSALSGIGRAAPDIFAEQAMFLVNFVSQRVLPSELAGSDFQETLLAAPPWARDSPADTAKAAAVKIMARAFVPDKLHARPPSEYLTAVLAVETELLAEMDLEILPSEGTGTPSDESLQDCLGFRRLAAATAMLRLARLHDTVLHVGPYYKLALTMQDTLTAVRAAFAVKVIRLMSFMCGVVNGARKASKYAALLALSAMDPVEANRQTAYTALQEFVAARRLLLERQASSAMAGPSGSALHEQPEFILPYLVQVLAHHPDFPSKEEYESQHDLLQPFSCMLQFALQSLLLSLSGPAKSAGLSFSMVVKILRTIKTTEDGSPEEATEAVHLLCDLGLAIARILFNEHCKGKETDVTKLPGGCCLPQAFFRAASHKRRGRIPDGGYLPSGYKVLLDNLFTAEASFGGGGTQGTKEQHSQGRGTPRTGPPARHDKIHSSHPHSTPVSREGADEPHTGKSKARQEEGQTRDSSNKKRRIEALRRTPLGELSNSHIAIVVDSNAPKPPRPDIEGNDQHESELQPSLIEPGPPSHRRGNTKVGEKAQDHAIQLAESDLEKRLLSQGKQAKEEANQGLESLRAPSEPSSTGPSDQNKLEADLPELTNKEKQGGKAPADSAEDKQENKLPKKQAKPRRQSRELANLLQYTAEMGAAEDGEKGVQTGGQDTLDDSAAENDGKPSQLKKAKSGRAARIAAGMAGKRGKGSEPAVEAKGKAKKRPQPVGSKRATRHLAAIKGKV